MSGLCSDNKIPTSQKKTTIKVYYNFGINVNKYFYLGKNNNFPKPDFCPICKKESVCLIGHGYYHRNAYDGINWYRILIKIWKCKNQKHGGYISVQPTFLLPYKQYTIKIIYLILHTYLLLKFTMLDSISKVIKNENRTSYQTVQHWLKGMKKKSGVWIGYLQALISEPIPLKTSGKRDSQLEQLFLLLEIYFKYYDKESQHEKLLKKYNGSPLTPAPVNK